MIIFIFVLVRICRFFMWFLMVWLELNVVKLIKGEIVVFLLMSDLDIFDKVE